mmetsp:Transcript_220/g.718  ORF Transcript_220/g.718 Transcript_220/m.718 type:complete len:215 (+) Transcript_220:610-1254(+)
MAEPLRPGDLLKFPRRFYDHWAMYIGRKDGVHHVIHIWNPDQELSMRDARVCVTPLHHVPNWKKLNVCNKWDKHYSPFSEEQITVRAVSRLGEKGYHVFLNNCEHFVTWARHGFRISDQVHTRSVPPIMMCGTLIGGSCAAALEILDTSGVHAYLGSAIVCTAAILLRSVLRRAVHTLMRKVRILAAPTTLHYSMLSLWQHCKAVCQSIDPPCL